MTVDFREKVAIVTGSTSGLGRAVVIEMANGGLGGAIVVGRDAPRGDAVVAELAALGTRAAFVGVDLAEPGSPSLIAEACDSTFGRVDVLVNAAALTTRNLLVEETVDHFDAVFAVNVRAPFFLMQAVIRLMIRDGIPGSIVNVGSVAGYVGAPELAAYSASKAALMTCTKSTAHAVAEHHIRVNQVNPGWMNTPAENLIQRRFHDAGDDWRERAGESLPFGRLIEPHEVARLIAHLASEEAGIITGGVIDYSQRIVGAP